MTVIELRFPAGGRLHATPWGRHVNEGGTEWPPSPWRFQRALVATWYLKSREIEEPVMRGLMEALAAVPPSFQLPDATQSHTRHYMPSKGGDKTKIFDTFVQSGKPLRMGWAVDLEAPLREALSILCERLGYLGRAESIVEAELLSAETTLEEKEVNARPLTEADELPPEQELVRLLCPGNPAEYTAWLAAQIPEIPSAAKAKKGKTRTAAPNLPANIFESLHADTATMQAQGWQIPPGSRWLDYTRNIQAFDAKGISVRRRSSQKVTVARFAIASSVLPRITKAISVAERMHQSLAKWADGKACAGVFTGKDPEGKPMENHEHTHIFCELGDKRDSIGFITLYAPMGFNGEAQKVIEDIQRKPLWGHGGHDLDLILLGFGDHSTFDTPIFAESKRWTSLTPFVSTRHAKHYADGRPKLDADGWPQGSPSQDLRRLILKQHGSAPKLSPPANTITVRKDRTLSMLEFQTKRHQGEGLHGHQPASAFTIEFEEPIRGPLAVGYGSHFGLGLFVPADYFHFIL
jgi:CRISPR-associated protein Csb2